MKTVYFVLLIVLILSLTVATPHDVFGKSGNSGSALLHASQASPVVLSSFSISANPQIVTIGQGLTQTTTITISSVTAVGDVVLTGISSSSLTLFFHPSTVQVTMGASVNSTMAITVANTATPGSYNVTVSGSNDGVSVNTEVFVTVTPSTSVGDFYLTPNPSSLLIPQGQARTANVTVSSVNGFNGTVKLEASAGVSLTASFNPTDVGAVPDGSTNSTMTIIIPSGTALGDHTLLISGTSGPLQRITSLTVIVVTSIDKPPIAVFTYTPTNPVAGHSVQFDASASYDPDGYVTGYSWAWGDGQSGTGTVASHSFDFPGQYTVTLTETDNGGAVGGIIHDVLVAPTVLKVTVATTPSPPRGTAPLSVGFTATGSGGIRPYSYSWEFGDGNRGSGQHASHTFATQGDYDVRVTITDSSNSTATSSMLVSVSAPVSGQLTVNVRDSNNNPIGGATVVITTAPLGQTPPPSQTTGANGFVTFLNLLPGSYTYKVSALGYSDGPSLTTTVLAGQTRTENTSLYRIQSVAPTMADYAIFYVAGALVLIIVLGTFLGIRRRYQAGSRRVRKQHGSR